MAVNKAYLVGSTVKIIATFTDPRSGELINPASVTLVSIVRTAPINISGLSVLHPSIGVYTIDVSTTGFIPGTYTWLIRAQDPTGRAALATDFFIVTSPA